MRLLPRFLLFPLLLFSSPCLGEEFTLEPDPTPYLNFPRFGFGFANLPHDAPCPVSFYHDGIGIALDPDFCPAREDKKPTREIVAYGSSNVAYEFPTVRAAARDECKGRPFLTRYTLDNHPSVGCRIDQPHGRVRLFSMTFRNRNNPDRTDWIQIFLELRTTREHWKGDLRTFEQYRRAFRIAPDYPLHSEMAK